MSYSAADLGLMSHEIQKKITQNERAREKLEGGFQNVIKLNSPSKETRCKFIAYAHLYFILLLLLEFCHKETTI